MAGRRLLQVSLMLGGLIAWALQFTAIYGITSTLCARGWADVRFIGLGIVPATILASTILALAGTAAVLVYAMRAQGRSREVSADATDSFINTATVFISALSLIVILWHGLPAFILPSCA